MKHSPAPWRWDVEEHSRNVLRAADGDTISLYDMPYSRPRGEMDVANRALISKAPEMASMLRELEWRDLRLGKPHCLICGSFLHEDQAAYNRNDVHLPATKAGQHTPDCRLAALLRDLP